MTYQYRSLIPRAVCYEPRNQIQVLTVRRTRRSYHLRLLAVLRLLVVLRLLAVLRRSSLPLLLVRLVRRSYLPLREAILAVLWSRCHLVRCHLRATSSTVCLFAPSLVPAGGTSDRQDTRELENPLLGIF